MNILGNKARSLHTVRLKCAIGRLPTSYVVRNQLTDIIYPLQVSESSTFLVQTHLTPIHPIELEAIGEAGPIPRLHSRSRTPCCFEGALLTFSDSLS